LCPARLPAARAIACTATAQWLESTLCRDALPLLCTANGARLFRIIRIAFGEQLLRRIIKKVHDARHLSLSNAILILQ
jgi:hypothetical protein